MGAQAVDVAGIKVLAARVEGLDAKALRDALDRLRQQLGEHSYDLMREVKRALDPRGLLNPGKIFD